MIIGIGSDLCNIERIQNSLDRWGEKFERRVFTDVERAKAARRPHPRAGTYTKPFAPQEAFSQAVGNGFNRALFMTDLGGVNTAGAQPPLALHGGTTRGPAMIAPTG